MDPLVEIIAREMQKQGAISFARFMELALYCPVYGYYEKEADTAGRRGDYYTSVSVGNLFGELLAFQFAAWLSDSKFGMGGVQILEAGAHDGRLACDILSWLRRQRPALLHRLNYIIIEPSERRRNRQATALSGFRDKVRWISKWAEFRSLSSGAGIRGIVFSNELLDAMPAHRVGWDAATRTWFEWGVMMRDGAFAWTRIELPAPGDGLRTPQLPEALQPILPDGFSTELCPAAEAWWRGGAELLQTGRMLTIDYGLASEEFFAPERNRGTLRAYYRHHLNEDPLANPGEQDLTAHVNFTAICQAGEAAGLKTEALLRQEKFLTDIAARAWKGGAGFDEWTRAWTRQFQTLTHPDFLGRPFRVLVQSRGLENCNS